MASKVSEVNEKNFIINKIYMYIVKKSPLFESILTEHEHILLPVYTIVHFEYVRF